MSLIQRKEEVRAEIAVCTRRLAAEAGQPAGARVAELRRGPEALMAEENRLRQLIDRKPLRSGEQQAGRKRQIGAVHMRGILTNRRET